MLLSLRQNWCLLDRKKIHVVILFGIKFLIELVLKEESPITDLTSRLDTVSLASRESLNSIMQLNSSVVFFNVPLESVKAEENWWVEIVFW